MERLGHIKPGSEHESGLLHAAAWNRGILVCGLRCCQETFGLGKVEYETKFVNSDVPVRKTPCRETPGIVLAGKEGERDTIPGDSIGGRGRDDHR